MAFLFTNLAQAVWHDMGRIPRLHQFIATGGSATTIQDTAINSREEQPDDNYAVDYTAVVVLDAGGLNASPEGKMARVSAFASGTTPAFTIDTVTDAIASGDTILMADSTISLIEMLRICNRALQGLGDVSNVSSSITSVPGTFEYDLPVGIKRGSPIVIEYDNGIRIVPFGDWHIRAATAGSAGKLVIDDPPTGTLYITYNGSHPELTAYNSPILEYIVPELAIAAGVKEAAKFIINTSEGGTDFDKQRYNEALQDLENKKMRFPIWSPSRQPHMFIAGKGRPYPGDQTIYNR